MAALALLMLLEVLSSAAFWKSKAQDAPSQTPPLPVRTSQHPLQGMVLVGVLMTKGGLEAVLYGTSLPNLQSAKQYV